MFGHGQVEGFTEKYGMEYQRPRYDETPNPWLVERHDREIAPLLKKRWLFAESSNFLLFDFFEPSGSVDENVFAFSNRSGGECALVVYNNRYGSAHGTIDFSAAYADKASSQLRQRRLSEGLGLSGDSGVILAWRDSLTGLEYLRRANELAQRGLTLHLSAYQSHVFLSWRELRSTAEQPWDRLCDHLNGRGVPNIDDALVNLELQPVHDALRSLVAPDVVRQLSDFAELPRGAAAAERKSARERNEFIESVWARCENFLRTAQASYRSRVDKPVSVATREIEGGVPGAAFREQLRAALRIPMVESRFPKPWSTAARRVLPSASPLHAAAALWGPVLGWVALELLAESIDPEKPERAALDLFDRLRLREPFAQAFSAHGGEAEDGWRAAARIKILLLAEGGAQKTEEPIAKLEPKAEAPKTGDDAKKDEGAADERPVFARNLWLDPDGRWLTGVHESEGQTYLVREPHEELLWWLKLRALLRLAGEVLPSRTEAELIGKDVDDAIALAATAGYRVDVLLGRTGTAERKSKAGTVTEKTPVESKETVPAASSDETPLESVTPTKER
jgi:hypothetical protein